MAPISSHKPPGPSSLPMNSSDDLRLLLIEEDLNLLSDDGEVVAMSVGDCAPSGAVTVSLLAGDTPKEAPAVHAVAKNMSMG